MLNNNNGDIEIGFMHMNKVSIITTNSTWKAFEGINRVRLVTKAFKKEADDIKKKNVFYGKSIRSIQITVNGQTYPADRPMEFNFEDGDVAEPYLAYVKTCRVFEYEPQFNIKEFSDYQAIFCFNTTSQPDEISKTNYVDVKIIKEVNSGEFTVYALASEENHLINNVVTKAIKSV